MIQRYLGEEASEFVVVGLMVVKAEVDSFSGSITHAMVCRLGNIKNPVNFLPFLEQAQSERQFQSV
jgi:hypothetical protein